MENKIKVLHLFYTFDVEVGGGGLSLFAIELGKNTDLRQFEIQLCSLGYYDTDLGKERIRRLNKEGLISYEATNWDDQHPYRSFKNSYQNLQSRLKNQPVDIIHSHSEYTDITAILLKLSRRTKRIIRTVHYGFKVEWSTKPIRRLLLTNFLYPIMFDKEVGINQQNTQRLNNRSFSRIMHRNSIRIPNAINTDRFKNIQINIKEKKKSLGIPPGSTLIGSVGRLADQKGYVYFLEAAAKLLTENPELYFILIGDGPMAEEHKNHAHKLGIDQNVIFTGGRTDVEELLTCFDLFISSSLWEGLPTVLLEAMAAGVPIIATDIPGTNELIENNYNGLLVEPYNSESLKSGIIKLLNSQKLRHQFSMNAYATLKDYEMPAIARKYEDLYLALIR
jgi:glycosyltransferase involved in cell wall biosynthesis